MKMGIFDVTLAAGQRSLSPRDWLDDGKRFAWRHLEEHGERPRSKLKMPEVIVLAARRKKP
jgi:hypothetical protein